MPIVKCPNCGRERLVVEGKRKKCRKCGTPLTSDMGYSASEGKPVLSEVEGPQAAPAAEPSRESQVDEPIDEATDQELYQELKGMTKAQLLKFAGDEGIEIASKMRKKEILAAIKEELSKPYLPEESNGENVS